MFFSFVCKNKTMNKLNIPKVNSVDRFCDVNSSFLEKWQDLKIDTLNWDEYSYKPAIGLKIAHSSNAVLLKFDVREKYIRALETQINGKVHKDSTVEFFISLDGENYYNFEFSCIGTIHVGYGPGRKDRERISPEILKKIEIVSSLGNQPFEEKTGDFQWQMVIKIPIECFVFDNLIAFDGVKATANFYKCGDETSEPHFVTWNPVKTATPDYHRPEFFAPIEFERE
jgi:hypothetical protein